MVRRSVEFYLRGDLRFAQQAVAAAPNSPTAFIALSYAQQARFDLEGARASLEKAVQLAPDNALAWARLAEIHSSFGELKNALTAAQKAVALEPNLARTQTVLEYAYLTQVKTKQAKDAFAKAIALDQADSLRGNARGWTSANMPWPRNWTPRDSTPWFYDAIAKQTTNRPVEALHDLQQAIELNDNRAVYRSRLSFWTLAKQQVVPGTRDETRHDHVVLPHCLITEGMGEIVGTKALGVLRVMRSSHVEKRPIGPGEPEGLWLLMRPSWE